jgi:hypothetical protein
VRRVVLPALLVLAWLSAPMAAWSTGGAQTTDSSDDADPTSGADRPGSVDRPFDWRRWERQLHAYVDADGRVAYRDWMGRGRDSLEVVIRNLGNAAPDAWPEKDQLAFWINAYNAGTVWAVFDGRSAESLLGRVRLFRFWSFRVAGDDRTLDEIEHDILRRRFEEPRIHFAIVCASTSCPPLRNEAYVAGRLDDQLDDQARRFINDAARNRIDRRASVVHLSKIFDWFEEDFTRHGSVLDYVARFVDDPRTAAWLRDGAPGADHDHLDYDWTLNAQPHQRPR